jgi:hypothetical protein
MKTIQVVGLVALAALTLAFATALPPQDAQAKARGDEAAMSEDMAAMMEVYTKAGAPGEVHRRLAVWAGEWKAKQRFWGPDPSAPAMEMEGSASIEVVMGGRFLIEHYEGLTPMGPFQGMHIFGFNKTVGQHESVWFDSMGTAILFTSGPDNPDGPTTLTGTFDDVMTGDKVAMRTVTTSVSDDEILFEMFEAREGAAEMKTMEVVYTRVAR